MTAEQQLQEDYRKLLKKNHESEKRIEILEDGHCQCGYSRWWLFIIAHIIIALTWRLSL